MDKEIFKGGDKVFHIEYGWGVIENINGSYYYITFGTYGTRIHCEHNILSFTEYTLQGFTQERPIVLPEKGELCLVRDNESQDWQVRKFLYYKEICNIFVCLNRDEDTEMKWKQMKRIKILD